MPPPVTRMEDRPNAGAVPSAFAVDMRAPRTVRTVDGRGRAHRGGRRSIFHTCTAQGDRSREHEHGKKRACRLNRKSNEIEGFLLCRDTASMTHIVSETSFRCENKSLVLGSSLIVLSVILPTPSGPSHQLLIGDVATLAHTKRRCVG